MKLQERFKPDFWLVLLVTVVIVVTLTLTLELWAPHGLELR